MDRAANSIIDNMQTMMPPPPQPQQMPQGQPQPPQQMM
jgi:hypothetical protein